MLNANHLSDSDLLGAVPEYLSVSHMLKANPVQEGGRRIIYIEASNESRDQQNEVVAAKALSDSAAYFRKFGNLDIDHITVIGAKQGIPDYTTFEIGRPLDVTVKNGTTFVKGEIYSGAGPAAEKANLFWESLTRLNPPARWFPSVGGAIPADGKQIVVDPKTGDRSVKITKVRWTNIGFSKTPVNPNLSTVQTMPFEAMAKSWMGGGFNFTKALEAGYGTDSASLSGGGALRDQSLDKELYSVFSDLVRSSQTPVSMPMLQALAASQFGFSKERATRFTSGFLRSIKARRNA